MKQFVAEIVNSKSAGLCLVGLLLVIGSVGCAGSVASPSVRLTAVAPIDKTAKPKPTASPSPTPTVIPAFAATGSMHVGRIDATATLLTTGKVLIAGGYSEIGLIHPVIASAELYDPATGQFTPTGSMTTARGGATATLLQDGRVLIAGGAGCRTSACFKGDFAAQQALASAELYDPTTGKFALTGSMTTARYSGTATLLSNGLVLLASGGDALTADLYAPDSGKFTRAASLSGFVYTMTATLVINGNVLLVGKNDGGAFAELYDPTNGKLTSISFHTGGRVAPETATLLRDGRVLLFESGYLETYDPTSGVVTPAGTMDVPGQWSDPTDILLADGRVLFEGGEFAPDSGANDSVVASEAALYDPARGPHPIDSMPAPRTNGTATLLRDGSVLIAGGSSDGQNALSSAELFK